MGARALLHLSGKSGMRLEFVVAAAGPLPSTGVAALPPEDRRPGTRGNSNTRLRVPAIRQRPQLSPRERKISAPPARG